jgi:hypothetical protein
MEQPWGGKMPNSAYRLAILLYKQGKTSKKYLDFPKGL